MSLLTDSSGIPKVLSTLTPEEERNIEKEKARVKRETATADALAQAKKIVAAENAKKEQAQDEKQSAGDDESKGQSKKRARDETDQAEGADMPKLKKVDGKDKAQNGAKEESMET